MFTLPESTPTISDPADSQLEPAWTPVLVDDSVRGHSIGVVLAAAIYFAYDLIISWI